ncbi:unnamed protein product [Sphacelaria rigidula]
MENYLTYLASTEIFEVSLNTDLFETNIINLGLLLVLLFIVIKNFLTDVLTTRKKKIIEALEKAETRLVDSQKRYNEAKKQLSQVDLVVQEMNNQMEITKQNIVKSKWNQAQDDLSKRFILAIEVLRSREKKIFSEVIKQITEKALTRANLKIKNELDVAKHSEIITLKLEQLGELNEV